MTYKEALENDGVYDVHSNGVKHSYKHPYKLIVIDKVGFFSHVECLEPATIFDLFEFTFKISEDSVTHTVERDGRGYVVFNGLPNNKVVLTTGGVRTFEAFCKDYKFWIADERKMSITFQNV